MQTVKKSHLFKKIFPDILAGLASIVTVVLTVICMSNFDKGFLYRHCGVITSVAVCIEILYIGTMLFFRVRGSETVSKFMLSGIVISACLLMILYVIQVTGLWEKIDSVEKLRNVIESTGIWAPIVFIVIQFLQVVVLPLPGTLTIGAGVLIFSYPILTCLYSYIGILLGSFVAFFIGKKLGYKVAAWLVGKDSLDKWLQKVKGKDRVILSAMFVLPLFPDDVLCFVAGLSTMSWRYFIVMQLIARAISVVTTVYTLNNSIIPYTEWWGILLWILIAAAIIALFVLLYKKGDIIEKKFFALFDKKKKSSKSGQKPEKAEIVIDCLDEQKTTEKDPESEREPDSKKREVDP